MKHLRFHISDFRSGRRKDLLIPILLVLGLSACTPRQEVGADGTLSIDIPVPAQFAGAVKAREATGAVKLNDRIAGVGLSVQIKKEGLQAFVGVAVDMGEVLAAADRAGLPGVRRSPRRQAAGSVTLEATVSDRQNPGVALLSAAGLIDLSGSSPGVVLDSSGVTFPDSDNDGVPNYYELVTGKDPNNSLSKPTPEEMTKASEVLSGSFEGAIQSGQTTTTAAVPQAGPSESGGDTGASAAQPTDASSTTGGGGNTTVPETTLLGKPAALTSSKSATFKFSTTGSRTFCKLDIESFTECSSPKVYDNLSEGSHTFSVKGVSAAGAEDPTPAAYSWKIDATPPRTNLLTKPTLLSNAQEAEIAFECSESGCDFLCLLDAGVWAACASLQKLTGLSDGAHAFQVKAVDLAGNEENPPASHGWKVDATAPDTAFGKTPLLVTRDTLHVFEFRSTEEGAKFECKLDGGGFSACVSPVGLTTLAEGGHTFSVRAIDAAGNVDDTPASFIWKIDITPPDTAFGKTPLLVTRDTSHVFEFTGTEPGSSFGCRLDAGEFKPCASPFTLSALAEGEHTFNVRAIDPAGNVDGTPASHRWTVDVTPPPNPTLTVTDRTSGSAIWTNALEINVAIGNDAEAAAWCISATQSTQPGPGDSCLATTEPTLAMLSTGDGTKILYVWIRDPAGNVNAGPVVASSITLDTTSPANPTLLLSDPSPATVGYTNNNPVTASIGNDAGVAAWCLTEESSVPAETASCFSASEPSTFMLSSGDGTKTVTVWVKDAAGNMNGGPAVGASIILDTAAPSAPDPSKLTVTMNPPGTNDTMSGGAGSVEGYVVVKVFSDGLLSALIGSVPALADGSFAAFSIGDDQANSTNQIYVVQIDRAGNQGAVTTKVNDITAPAAPTIAGTTPASPGSAQTPTVTGTAEAYAAVNVFDDGALIGSGTANAGGIFGFVVTTVVTLNASNTLSAKATDAAGNVSAASLGFAYIHDSTPPTGGVVDDGTGTDIDMQAITTAMDANWSGFTDANGIASYDYNLSTSTACAGNIVSTVNVGNALAKSTGGLSLASGTTYTNCVRAIDNAGNIGPWIYSDGVIPDPPPTSTITVPAQNSKRAVLNSVTGAASDVGSGLQKVDVSVRRNSDNQHWNGSGWASTVTWIPATGTTSWSFSAVPVWVSGISYTIQSRATDNSGQVETAPPSVVFTFDDTAPTFAGLSSAIAVSPIQANLSWSAGVDNVTSSGSLIYRICKSTSSTACQTGFAATYTTAAGETNYSVTGLTEGTQYYFLVRAVDEAGTADGNTVQKSVLPTAPATCPTGTWTEMYRKPTATDLYAVKAFDANAVWAAGYGAVIRTTNGGNTWTCRSSAIAAQASGAFALVGGTVWVLDQSKVSRSVDTGVTWTSSTLPGGSVAYGMDFVTDTAGWVVGLWGKVFKTTDGGVNWTAQTSITSEHLHDVIFVNGLVGYAVGTGGTIIKTSDGGTTWAAQTSGTTEWLRAVGFLDATTGWAVGAQGTIRKTTDGGITWIGQTAATTDSFCDVDILNATTAYLADCTWSGGRVYRTTDGGLNWSYSTPAVYTPGINGVDFVDASTGFAVGPGGALVKTIDGGSSWASLTTGDTAGFKMAQFLSADVGYVAGGGKVLKMTDGGAAWSALSVWINPQAMYFVDATTGWVVGSGGEPIVFKTTDGGATWPSQSLGTSANLSAVYFLDTNTGWLSGYGKMFRTTNGGTTWTITSLAVNGTFPGLHFANASTGVAVGTSGQVLRTTDGGASWTLLASGVATDLTDAKFGSTSTVYAVGCYDTILKSTNGGQSWTNQYTASLGSVCARSVHVFDADRVYVLDDSSDRLIVTTNGGTTWSTRVIPGSGNGNLFDFSFVDPNLGFVVGWSVNNTYGRVLKTVTGGQ